MTTEIVVADEECARTRSRRMYQSDMESNRLTAEYNGEHRAKIEIAKKLLTRNRPMTEIIEDTGLTRAEVETLRQ